MWPATPSWSLSKCIIWSFVFCIQPPVSVNPQNYVYISMAVFYSLHRKILIIIIITALMLRISWQVLGLQGIVCEVIEPRVSFPPLSSVWRSRVVLMGNTDLGINIHTAALHCCVWSQGGGAGGVCQHTQGYGQGNENHVGRVRPNDSFHNNAP